MKINKSLKISLALLAFVIPDSRFALASNSESEPVISVVTTSQLAQKIYEFKTCSDVMHYYSVSFDMGGFTQAGFYFRGVSEGWLNAARALEDLMVNNSFYVKYDIEDNSLNNPKIPVKSTLEENYN